MISALQMSRPGPLARTREELLDIERRARFRRRRLARARLRLRESDALLDLVEECRLREIQPVPAVVWSAAARLVGSVEPELRDDLGINRDADHLSDVIFAAQEVLQAQAREELRPQLAPIIPLFPDPED